MYLYMQIALFVGHMSGVRVMFKSTKSNYTHLRRDEKRRGIAAATTAVKAHIISHHCLCERNEKLRFTVTQHTVLAFKRDRIQLKSSTTQYTD